MEKAAPIIQDIAGPGIEEGPELPVDSVWPAIRLNDMLTARKLAKKVLPQSAVDLLRYSWYHYQVRRLTRIESAAPPLDPPMPPPVLRYRVHGGLDRDRFDAVGRTCARNIEDALADVGRPLAEFSSVLDFACGCGRIMRHLVPPGTGPHRFYGCDIDAEAIGWNNTHLDHLATWAVNPMDPPTEYATGQFELVFSVSLLTHLDEASQFRWLEEFRRILAPKGLILLTFHGPFCFGDLSSQERETVETSGFLYKQFWTGRMKLDGLPESYQLTYHTPEYVHEHWGEYFDVLRYMPQGINNHQDLMVMGAKSGPDQLARG